MAGRLDSATDQLPDFGRVPVPTSLALEMRVRIVSLGGELETVPAHSEARCQRLPGLQGTSG